MAGRVIAIRVQDIIRGLWFNWDLGSWSGSPSCTPGTNAVYVSFWVINEPVYVNGQYHTDLLTLRLLNASTGAVLASKSVSVSSDPVNGGAGLEWTGNMPSTNFVIRCEVTP